MSLSAFARLPAVARVPNSMKDLVDRTLALYEGRLDGVTVRGRCASDLPPILIGLAADETRSGQSVDNALELSPANRSRS